MRFFKSNQHKLFLDDLRPCPNKTYTLVRSFDEAVQHVKKFGIPHFISFDHDLGVDNEDNLTPTGYDFAKWLVEMDMNFTYMFPEEFEFTVHSANPIGKENIDTYLNNYLKHKKEELSKNIIRSTKEVPFNPSNFTYNLFWSSGINTMIRMDDIIYKYLMQPTQENVDTLIQLYGKDNVKRVLNNIRVKEGDKIANKISRYI